MFDAISQWAAALGDTLSGHLPLFVLFIFGIATVEFILVAGFVVPSAAVLFLTGTFIATGKVPLWPLLSAAIVGAVVGETVSYMAGRRLRNEVNRVWLLRDHPQYLSRAEALFARYGLAAVVVGRFVPWVDCVVPAIAGGAGMRFRPFMALNVVSAVGWAMIHILPGMAVGTWLEAMGLPPQLAIVTGGALLIALYAIFRLAQHLRKGWRLDGD